MVEESIRVPLIFSFPGRITFPQRMSELVDHTDVFQTILDFAGVELNQQSQKEGNYPGKSFFHKLVNDTPLTSWRKYQFCEYGDVRMIRDHRFKLIRRYPDGPCEFFDLLLDKGEIVNLFEQEEYQSIIIKMTNAMDSFYSTYQDEINNGLNVKKLPPHNSGESWRDPRNLH